jgi:DNA ligase D
MGSSTQQQSGEIVIDNHTVSLTNVTKPLWPKQNIRKLDFLHYLTKAYRLMKPFLSERVLTTIRYPHGVGDDFFYQKNCPDYAPEFVERVQLGGINYIVCNNLATLIWLGNQAALEYHIPFSTYDTDYPSEIVFDLDPPSRNEFSLAIEAAQIIKSLLDKLHLTSFIKTSGNKGLQIYIPIKDKTYSYDDTRIFTSFIAHYLIEKQPQWFTIERLKEKRNNKLYVDYLQHAKGKTIIAPYSMRANADGLVATPLNWKEVSSSLRPNHFPMEAVLERLDGEKCPFDTFFKAKEKQPLNGILQRLKANG